MNKISFKGNQKIIEAARDSIADKLPKWRADYDIDQVQEEVIRVWREEFNAILELGPGPGSVSFPNEQDYVMFVLRWS